MVRVSTIVVSLLCLLLAAPAGADRSKRKRAEQHYNAGVSALEAQEWDTAIGEFMQALTLDPNPVLVFNVARAYELKGDKRAALSFFRQYASMDISQADQADVQGRMAGLESALKAEAAKNQVDSAPGRVVVRCNAPGAVASVDGKPPVSLAAPLMLGPGTHFVVVSAPGFLGERRKVEVAAGSAQQLNLELAEAPDPGGMSGVMVGGIATAATGAALLIAAGVIHGTAEVETVDAEGCRIPAKCVSWDAQTCQCEDASLHDPDLTVPFVLYGLGGVVAATGIVLIVVDAMSGDDGDPSEARFLPGFTPAAGGGTATLRWRF